MPALLLSANTRCAIVMVGAPQNAFDTAIGGDALAHIPRVNTVWAHWTVDKRGKAPFPITDAGLGEWPQRGTSVRKRGHPKTVSFGRVRRTSRPSVLNAGKDRGGVLARICRVWHTPARVVTRRLFARDGKTPKYLKELSLTRKPVQYFRRCASIR